MGGMVVNIGDKSRDMKYIDMSTATKVETYLNLIKQPAAYIVRKYNHSL